jgi:steroid delta-isomerase-like uncharacterized protein
MTETTTAPAADGVAERFLHFARSGRVDDPTLFADDFVYHDAMGYDHGLAEAVGLHDQFLAAIPDAAISILDSVVTDERILFRWESTGVQTGAFLGIPASNRRVTNRGVTILRVADGVVAEMWDYVDLLGLLQQMGAVPPLGQA